MNILKKFGQVHPQIEKEKLQISFAFFVISLFSWTFLNTPTRSAAFVTPTLALDYRWD